MTVRAGLCPCPLSTTKDGQGRALPLQEDILCK
jgi:hypothetical protein